MRLAIASGSLFEWIGLRLGLIPRPLLEMMGGLLLARALIAGVRLGIFEALETAGPASPEELSRRLDLDPGGTRSLLRALAGSGYLRSSGGRYANTRAARRWLLSRSPRSIARYTRFLGDQALWLDDLETYVREGGSVEIHDPAREAGYWERYLGALEELAVRHGASILRAIPLSRPPRKMLDVAGGHGHFSVALCRAHPGLRSEILDIEPAVAAARPRIAAASMEERVTLRVGDLRTSDWGSGYDLVLLFNILHHLSESDARAACVRARSALCSGGTLAIWEIQETSDESHPSQIGGLMSLFFFVTSGRRVPPRQEIEGWMRGAGFERIRARTLRQAPFGYLLTGLVTR
jgi:hypothetical protein